MATDAQALLLQVSADTSKALKALDGLSKRLSGLGDDADKAGKRASTGLERFFGKTDAGKALDKVFDSTRFKVLDSGIARVGIFGSALESLGPAGLAAAAGIGAFAAALGGAREAAKFADDINDTANRLHVTTDALQEYRYAIRAAGGEEKDADAALESFRDTLGRAEGGVTKALRPFKELFGKTFSAEDVQRLGGAEGAINAITKAIQGLNSEQQDAVLGQFGLGPMKQLIEQGPEAMARLRAEAHKLGLVMDSELVKRGGELNDQFETVQKVIDLQLKSTLVDLGPILLGLLTILSDMAGVAADIADAFRGIGDKTTRGLKRQLADLEDEKASGVKAPDGAIRKFTKGIPVIGDIVGAVGDARDALSPGVDEKIRTVQGELAKRFWTDALARTKLPTPTKNLFDASGGGTDRGPAQAKHFNDELARIQDRLLSASDDELHTLEQRQAIARERLANEAAAHLQSILDQVQTKAITETQGKILLGKYAEADQAKARELLAQQAIARQQLQLRLEKDLVDSAAALLDAQVQLTTTVEQRVALEGAVFDAQRAIARKVLDQALNADPDKSPAQRAAEISNFDATTDFMRGARSVKTWADLADQQQQVADAQLGAQMDAAQLQGQLAETMKARRDAELKILDLQYEEQRKRLLNIVAISNNTAEIEAAQIQLKALEDNHAARIEVAKRGTRGPLEQFRSGLPLDPEKLNEALENVNTHGLQTLEDGLVGVIGHTQKLGDVFRQVANQIIADLARIAIEQAIIGPLEAAITGGVSSAASSFASLFKGGRAGGGPVSSGSAYLVGEHGPEIFAPRVSGSIIPNGAIKSVTGKGGGVTQQINQYFSLDARGSITTAEFVAGLDQRIDRVSTAKARSAAAYALQGVPSRSVQYQRLGT